MNDETFNVTFRASGPGPPAVSRIKRLLKIAGRYLGLQCLSVNNERSEPNQHDQQPEQGQESDVNILAAFPSDYLKASDLNGQDMVLTISKVTIETVGSGDEQEQKPIIHFREVDKGLVLNKTNANTLAEMLGPETDRWTGQRIALFGAQVDFQGRQVEAIRVRIRQPASAGSSAPPAAPPASDANQAKRAAWGKWKAQHKPDEDPQVIAEGFKAAVKAYFPGRPPELLSAREWDALVADGFVRKPDEDPLADAPPVFSDADIPF